jgi:23S rRNA pseudouridine1911/1915/1917 synthase
MVTDVGAGVRLDKFLAAPERLGSRRRVVEALARGKLFLNGSEVGIDAAATPLKNGDTVRLWMDRPGSAKARLRPTDAGDVRILYEDDQVIVVNKPAGLLTVPLERRSERLSAYDHIENHLRPRGKRRPLVVHRIDRDTSGLVVFAKTARAQAQLKEQFKRREPERVYLAVVAGRPSPAKGTWHDHLLWDTQALIQKRTTPNDPRGREATSTYCAIESFARASLLEVRLHTGKRNQIRIQARLRGHPLIGERRYVSAAEAARRIDFPRQALHAYQLTFQHPADGRTLSFEAPVPRDLEKLLARLRKEER